VLVVWIFSKDSPALRITLPRVAMPLAVMLALTAAGMGYYLWRVTGSPVRMPYQIERQEYAVAPYMIWQKVRPEPVYRHPAMRKMYVEEELLGYKASRTLPGVVLKLYYGWNFFFGPALTLPFLLLVFVLPRDFSIRGISTPTRFFLSLLLICTLGWTVESFYSPHYSAPATGVFLALVLLAMRQVRRWGTAGLFLTRAIALICVLSFAIRIAAVPLRFQIARLHVFAWHQQGAMPFERGQMLSVLQQLPGKQLVIVRYAPEHEPFSEWVYNDADIDNSKVVWAREMDPAENQRLITYFKDRHIWLLEANKLPLRFTPYQLQTQGDSEGWTGPHAP